MSFPTILTFSTSYDDQLGDDILVVDYLGETIFSANIYQLKNMFLTLNYHKKPSFSDMRGHFYLFDQTEEQRLFQELHSDEYSSTVGWAIDRACYPLLQSNHLYFVYGHPTIRFIPKDELNALCKYYSGRKSPLEEPIQFMSNKNVLNYWLLSSGYEKYLDVLLANPKWPLLWAFQKVLLAEHPEHNREQLSIRKLMWGLEKDIFKVDLDTFYMKEEGKEITGYFDMGEGKTFEWNALSLVNNKWYLLIDNWMFQISGIEDYPVDAFDQWHKELEEALF